MLSIQYLEQRQKEFEAAYDLLNEKISRLRKEKILETDISVRFKLEKQLEDFVQERESIEEELQELIEIKLISPLNREFSTEQLSSSQIYQNLIPKNYSKFIGREEEIKKLVRFLSSEYGLNIITVDGIGGVGKTSLVLEVAYRCLEASRGKSVGKDSVIPTFDAIIFTSAKQDTLTTSGILPRHQSQRSLQDIFQEISRTLDRSDIIRVAPEEQLQTVRKHLNSQRTLLIIDNLETIEDKQGILSFLYELPAKVKVVITTRERQSITPIRLTELPESQGLQFIKQKAGELEVGLDEEQEKALYYATGGIPAAIIYTIGQISTGYSVQTVLNRTKSASGDVARFCFKGSVEPLQGKSAHHLLMAISIFPKSPIRDALAYVAGYTDPIIVEEGLVQLQRLSLVTQTETRYSLLPLTREYALAELAAHSQFREEARERWVEWYQNFAQKYGGSTRYRQEWQIDYDRLEGEWENIQEVLNWSMEQERYNNFKSLWDNVKTFTNIYGYWHIRLTCSDWLIQAAGRRGDLSTVMQRLSDKGRVLHKMGRLDEALSFLNEAWTFREHRDDPVLIAILAGRISETLLLQEKYEDAAKWLNRAEVIIETQLPEERKRRELFFTMYRRALLYYKTKNYGKAEEYLQTVVKQFQALQWDRFAMFAQEVLNEIKIAQGKLDEAKDSSKTGLATAIRIKDKRLIACYKRSFALLAKKSDDYNEMRYWADAALEGFEALGAIHEANEMRALFR